MPGKVALTMPQEDRIWIERLVKMWIQSFITPNLWSSRHLWTDRGPYVRAVARQLSNDTRALPEELDCAQLRVLRGTLSSILCAMAETNPRQVAPWALRRFHPLMELPGMFPPTMKELVDQFKSTNRLPPYQISSGIRWTDLAACYLWNRSGAGVALVRDYTLPSCLAGLNGAYHSTISGRLVSGLIHGVRYGWVPRGPVSDWTLVALVTQLHPLFFLSEGFGDRRTTELVALLSTRFGEFQSLKLRDVPDALSRCSVRTLQQLASYTTDAAYVLGLRDIPLDFREIRPPKCRQRRLKEVQEKWNLGQSARPSQVAVSHGRQLRRTGST